MDREKYAEFVTRCFSSDFLDQRKRIDSFDLLENFISDNYSNWGVTPPTEKLANELSDFLENLDIGEFAFLLCHSGYIPEIYEPDSSQETLYSKLVEALVKEWAIRIGFTESYLPTQKSSMEDVSITDGESVIVCDTKAFRLGRSQAAPNVKDVLKHADIRKWLDQHVNRIKVGGLVVFPQQHDWKKGSDYYQYTTDHSLPTLSLYYEHLAFMLISGFSSKDLVSILLGYEDIFPRKISKSENNREVYYQKIESQLFGSSINEWHEFIRGASLISREKVFHTLKKLTDHINRIHSDLELRYRKETDIRTLQTMVIDSETQRQTEDLRKQVDRIKSFRSITNDYL